MPDLQRYPFFFQESIVPDPFRNLAQFLIQSITPFFLYGGGAMTPAGNLCMIIDMTNRFLLTNDLIIGKSPRDH